jgi:hypothetical protein
VSGGDASTALCVVKAVGDASAPVSSLCGLPPAARWRILRRDIQQSKPPRRLCVHVRDSRGCMLCRCSKLAPAQTKAVPGNGDVHATRQHSFMCALGVAIAVPVVISGSGVTWRTPGGLEPRRERCGAACAPAPTSAAASAPRTGVAMFGRI